MAQETRAQLYAKILANLPDNTTEAITPATDRAVEDAEVESCYNLLDDDATNVTYNPTTVADWGATVPAEVGDGLDILIKKVSTNASQNIAYVSETGSDIVNEYEIGNPLKPFATIQAAVDAVGNNSTVKVLGGTYTESLITIQKNNFFLDCQGVTLNGSIWFKDCNDVGANFTGSEVIGTGSTATLRFTGTAGSKKSVIGGKFTQSTSGVNVCTGNDANIIGCEFVATGTAYGVSLTDSKILLSTVKTAGGVNGNNNGSVWRCIDSIFSFCIFEDTGVGRNCYNTKEFNTFYDCYFKSDGVCIKAEANIGLKGKFVNCEMESLSSHCVDMNGNSNRLAFYNCKLVGSTDTFDLSDLSSSVSARTGFTPITTILDNCEMFAGTGNIFNEPVSYDAADTGVTLVKYCTYNKDYTVSIPSKLIEQYVITTGATGTNTGLQNI